MNSYEETLTLALPFGGTGGAHHPPALVAGLWTLRPLYCGLALYGRDSWSMLPFILVDDMVRKIVVCTAIVVNVAACVISCIRGEIIMAVWELFAAFSIWFIEHLQGIIEQQDTLLKMFADLHSEMARELTKDGDSENERIRLKRMEYHNEQNDDGTTL